MSRIMITGATTPSGRALTARLLADPDTERLLLVGIEPLGEALAGLSDDRVTYEQMDLTRSRSMRHLLFGTARDLEIEAIAHLAQHRSATASGAKVQALNVEATRRLLQMAERHPTLRRFVLRSHGLVYEVKAVRPQIMAEDHPLNLSPSAPQWIRDRVAADLTVCTRMGMSPLSICVLRCAEVLAPDTGSQLCDYLQSKVCFRPAGFDPMIGAMTLEDVAEALCLALTSNAQGVFNIPAKDVLPLSEVVRKWGRIQVPVPGPLMRPLYGMRARVLGMEFRYDLNDWRFHFSGVLDGRRAAEVLGYVPSNPVSWPDGSRLPSRVTTKPRLSLLNPKLRSAEGA